MITAEVSHWSVTCYAGDEADRTILRKVYDAALARRMGAGSVGIVDAPSEGTLVHVDLMHCDQKEAEAIFAEAGVAPEQVSFKDVEDEPDADASKQNRRKRFKRP